MNKVKYSALIRTFNSERTIPETLSSLRRQTIQPVQYIFVDSGSNDKTLLLIPENSVVHHFVGNEFNYSEALNQGLEYVSVDFVLIISSHTSLLNPKAVEYALEVLRSNEKIGAAYFAFDATGGLRYRTIDKHNFNGFNGLINTCSLIKVPLLRRRSFRPEVFASEDQEWARWLFYHEGRATACISGAGMVVNNPRKKSLKKKVNDYVSIAYYSNRSLLSWNHIARIAYNVVKLGLRDRLFNLVLFFRLVTCRFVKPRSKSRYF